MPRRLRVFAGGLATETNSFSPLPTGYDDFAKARAGDPTEARDRIFFGRSFRAYEAVARERGADLVLGSYCFATPAGPPPAAVYARLRDELLAELDAALPVDGVLLTLHGAMVCDGVDDCESDLVLRVRELAGNATVGVLLDLHCDLPQRLVDAADVVVIVKEYPHVDVEPCARRLATIVFDTASQHVAPVAATFDCRMVGLYPTVREPMRSFVDGVLHALERERGILAASLGHGFPYLDSDGPGARALVVADGDRALAERAAERVGRAAYAIRREAVLAPLSLREGLDRALAPGRRRGPVVVADIADNAGGGAPSDSTHVLRALLERDIRAAGLAPLWDPVAVGLAFAAETGARLELRLGGKIGPGSGVPLDVDATVKGLVRGLVQQWPQVDGDAQIPVGDAAWLEVGGVDVIVVSRRDQAFGLELFTAFGIDPREKRILVLKSANHFRAAYDPIASEVLYVDAGGTLPTDPRAVPYTRFDRRSYPWIDDPLGLDSV
jgi:microcystin degradation protein MlrC